MTSKSERQKQQRRERREAERKAARRKETIRRVGSALGFGAVVALGLFAISFFGADDSELPGTYQRFRDQPTACGADAPEPATEMSFPQPEDQDLTGPVTATIATSCGDIVVELDPESAPNSVNSFVFLAREGFYDGTVFHRIADGFVIQGGDPLASGIGGPGYQITDEFPDSDFVYSEGVVAMAKAAASNSTGSQFFIVEGPDARALSPTFNVLGRVVEGMDTVNRIADVEVRRGATREESDPLESVYIESVTIDE